MLFPSLLLAFLGWTPEFGTAADTGTMVGTVRYQPDPARPWRQGRYYVKPASGGPLSEAVVALRISGGLSILPDRPAQVFAIDQKDFQFTPETVVLQVGDSVKFTNSDPGIHNVHAFGPIADFNVSLVQGQEHVQKFSRAGGIGSPVKIDCVFHGAMQAWIFVFRHPHFALTKSDGRFRFEGLPPGEYTIDFAHPAGGLRGSRTVTVEASKEASIELTLTPDDIVKN